jgi:hypothetical protein
MRRTTLGRASFGLISAAALVLLAADCFAEEFGGVDFPLGARSFADTVIRYDLHDATDVLAPYDDPKTALGPPDYTGTETGYVCLGNAPDTGTTSELIVRFDDNALIDGPGDDLYIFEIGPNVEATIVAVSPDGSTWYDLGRIEGSTRGIDLAAFPSVPKVQMRYVRLNDYRDGEASPSPFGGPDIDAIGAIGSVAASPVEAGVEDAGAEGGGGAAVDAGLDATSGTDGATGSASGGAAGKGAGGAAGEGTGGAGGKGRSSGGASDVDSGPGAPCKPAVTEVTRCECSAPGRARAPSYGALAGTAAALALFGRRRRTRPFGSGR